VPLVTLASVKLFEVGAAIWVSAPEIVERLT